MRKILLPVATIALISIMIIESLKQNEKPIRHKIKLK